MGVIIRGSVLKYGDNINTDLISPPQYMELSVEEAAKYAMSNVDPDFYKKAGADKILVAGKNFGSGSSRETSPLTLKYLGITTIVARFFARIFYRNAINLGMTLLECPQTSQINDGDLIEIDLDNGWIQNLTQKDSYACSRIPPHIMRLIQDGGLVENLKKNLRA